MPGSIKFCIGIWTRGAYARVPQAASNISLLQFWTEFDSFVVNVPYLRVVLVAANTIEITHPEPSLCIRL